MAPLQAEDRPRENPQAMLLSTSQQLLSFTRERDALALLAKTGVQFLIENSINPQSSEPSLIQAQAELLQAFVLIVGIGKPVPTSPRNMIRIWEALKQNIEARIESFRPGSEGAIEVVTYRARLHTICYRNIFSSKDAEEILPALLSGVDKVSVQQLGYALSDFAAALFKLFHMLGERMNKYMERVTVLLSDTGAVQDEIAAIRRASPVADRAWRFAESRFRNRSDLGKAGFQLSELACAPIFILDRAELEDRFGRNITDVFYRCAIPIGTLDEAALDRIHVDNPIWTKPFILLADGRLFLPIPGLVVSFPFMVVEGVIGSNERLNSAYSQARTRYLEEAVEGIVHNAMPNARIFTNVKWNDPDTHEDGEHDVVAVLDNQLIVFEARSGKLSSSSRRGGIDSLKTNFKYLFVKPGRQASRLERLLARGEAVSGMLKDKNGKPIDLDLSTPYVVHKFGICIEHFPGMTTCKDHFLELGLIEAESDWAPILSIGELRMIATFLDTEISFFHYLTRRSTIEEVIKFLGDEQDLLSMYLTNGFNIDTQNIAGRHIIFKNADALVRTQKEARRDKMVFETPGVFLPPMWRLIAEELYLSGHHRRFAMLEIILNQDPSALAGVARRVRNWKGGCGGKDHIAFIRRPIGRRTFVLAFALLKQPPSGFEDWHESARQIALNAAAGTGGTDCIVLYRSRSSRSLTFDGVSFFRFRLNERPPSDASPTAIS